MAVKESPLERARINALKKTATIFMTRKVRIGDESYTRWFLLPNRFRKPSKEHEPEVINVYATALKLRKGAFIDVGVNKGQTLTKLLAIDKNRQYIGFEPQSMAAACAEGFLIENGITNFSVFPVALSDRNGTMPMNVMGAGLMSMASPRASLVTGFRPGDYYGYTRNVCVARGDDIVNSMDVSEIAIIKIDAEGGELEVVRGFDSTIDKFRPILLIEVLPSRLKGVGELDEEAANFRKTRRQELERIIRSKRYGVYQIIGNKGIQKVDQIEPKAMSARNFIAVPEEGESEFCTSLGISSVVTAEP